MPGRDNHDNDPYNECGFFRLDEKDSGNPASAWYLEHFHGFLRECGSLLSDNIGLDNTEAIILGGSFALGEGTISFESGNPIFLSDIDLLVVLNSREKLLESLALRKELGEACEGLIPEATFLGRVDVGIVHVDELGSFSPSPGVFVLKNHGHILYGKEMILDMLPSFNTGDIEVSEGLLLLENRMASLLSCWPENNPEGEDEIYGFFYNIARVYTDILTGILIVSKEYVSGYQKRWISIDEKCDSIPCRNLITKAMVRKTRKWSVFKINPSLDILEVQDCEFREMYLECAEDILEVWGKCAAALDKDARVPLTWKGLQPVAVFRSDRHGIIDWMRSWKPIAARIGRVNMVRTAAFLGRALFSSTPAGIVRAASLHLLAVLARNGTGNLDVSPPGGFPYSGGDWNDGAESCHRWWSRIVFGR
ncbi:MAG: nucleotidyltransferase domain-containing protein [Candidatus Krumholzibacteria bacterium]|nr:nucleotidyltransferase domain-containing protein [Candidatus Krumholzibacteria bacterium]